MTCRFTHIFQKIGIGALFVAIVAIVATFTAPAQAQIRAVGATSAESSVSATQPDFPETLVAFQQRLNRGADAFVTRGALQTDVNVSPSKLSFHLLLGTTSKAKEVTLTNLGAASLTINQIYISGENASDFAENNNCPDSLAPGANCTISVTCTPTAKNKRLGTLTINDSDPASPQTVSLIGVSTVVKIAPGKLAFGNQPVRSFSYPMKVVVFNTSSAALNFSGLAISGENVADFILQSDTCLPNIPAYSSCNIEIVFGPLAQGTRRAVLRIYDDGGASPQSVGLIGNGT
jgi:hypothetical protein